MAKQQITRYDALAKPLKVFFIAATIAGIGFGIYFIFGLCIGGVTFYDAGYYYLLFGLFGSCVFLVAPENKTIEWYDLALSALFFGICIYFFSNAKEIVQVGWVPASTFDFALACIFLLICLEACRRVTGLALPVVCIIFGVYPLIADHMPGVLEGVNYPFNMAVAFYTFGGEGVLGIPGKTIGGILLGFLVFSGLMIASGAGEFFLEIAYALLGKYRGGPAKVAVVSSGLFGSLSGSVLSNVAATGSITIPAMKRVGYPSYYAAAVEACASSGGMLMPPVMGAVAFIMCAVLEIPYSDVIVAAAVPSVLYYSGLLFQIDGYAAKVGLKGLPKEESPSLWGVLKRGWPFATVLVFLMWGLIYMRWELMTPFYASALLFLLSFTNRKTMMTPRRLVHVLGSVGRLIATTVGIFLPLGIIISAITVTGLGPAFASGVVSLGGQNMVLVIVLGVICCYVMGMAGLVTPAYIFLASTLAPVVIQIGGLNVLAVHMFIVYYAVLAMITPPIAAAAFLASGIAGASAMKTAFTAMRLGMVKYFIPFFFVFNPALIVEGPILETLYRSVLCLLGILLMAGGLEGYLLKVGRLDLGARPLLIVGGFLIGFPEWDTTFIGAALALLAIAMIMIRRTMAPEKVRASE